MLSRGLLLASALRQSPSCQRSVLSGLCKTGAAPAMTSILGSQPVSLATRGEGLRVTLSGVRMLQTGAASSWRATGTTSALSRFLGRGTRVSLRVQHTPMSSSTAPQSSSRGFVAWYSRMLVEKPYITKALTAGLIGFTGDTIAQLLGDEQYDWHRVARFTAVQTLFLAPLLHVWYMFLARFFSGTGLRLIAKKLAMDQFLLTPLLLPVYMAVLLTVEGRGDEALEEISRIYKPTLIKAWQLWIPAQLVNFWVVPVPFQVLFSNTVGLVWSIYLSIVAHEQHGVHKHEAHDLNPQDIVALDNK